MPSSSQTASSYAVRAVRRTAAAAAVLMAGVGCSADLGTSPPPPPSPPDGEVSLAMETVVDGLDQPIYLAAPAGDPRLFILEQGGRIRIVREGVVLAEPFLDLSAEVSRGNEQGLLSLAFHPEYGTNGWFYVDYTDQSGNTRVERYTVGPDPDRADPGSAKRILLVAQPFANHNGGHLLFGPDGMLYVSFGDGGGAGDPQNNGQNAGNPLGSLLRLDVDGGDPYAIPADNPFGSELWAIGLRNPWRIAFDPPTGVLYVTDVGQSRLEEINAVDADVGGLNYGWNLMEGDECFGGGACDPTDLVLPVLEYGHDEGCSVIGGFAYRGSRLPELAGHYFYSDFCAGFLRSFRWSGNEVTDATEWGVGDLGSVTSFGRDGSGELYLLTRDGRVLKLVRAS